MRLSRPSILALLGTLLLSVLALHILSVDTTFSPAIAATECNDDIDNDGDGYTDYPGDPDCDSLSDGYEGNAASGDVYVSMTDGKDTVSPGGSLIYALSLSTSASAEYVDVRLRLPAYTYLTGANEGGHTEGAFVVWEDVYVNAGSNRRLTANVAVNPNAPEDTILVAEARVGGRTTTDTTRVRGRSGNYNQPSVRLSVTDGKVYAQTEEILEYRIAVENLLNYEQTVDINGQLPVQFVLHEVSGPHDRDGRDIDWNNITLAPGGVAEFFVTGQVNRNTPDYYALRFSVTAEGVTASDTTSIAPPTNTARLLGLSLTDSLSTAKRGQELTYELTLTNNTDDTATNVMAQANLPQFTDLIDIAEASGRWTGTEIQWRGLSIAPRSTRTLRYTVRIQDNAPLGSDIRAGAVVEGREARDTTRIDGTSQADTTTRRPTTSTPFITLGTRTRSSNAALTKTVNKTEVRPGDTVRYTIRLRNTTNQRLSGVDVVDSFTAGQLRILSSNGTVSNDSIRWRVPTLNPGQIWETSYEAQVNPNLPHGTRVNNVAILYGENIASIPLPERRTGVQTGVITQLPATGASLDTLFVMLTAMISLGLAAPSARRFFV